MTTRFYFHNIFYPRYNYGIYSNVGGFNQGFRVGGISPYIGFGNNKFLASTGYAGELIISSDGSDWEKITVTGMGIVNTAHYASALGLWILADQTGHIYTSPDLVNWTLRFSAGATITVETILYANGIAVAVAKNSGTPNTSIYSSTDAITWTTAGTTNFSSNQAAFALAYSPTLNLWVAGGQGGRVNYTSNPAGGVWTSNTSTNNTVYALFWDSTNSRFFGVGSGGTWWSSTNGTTWTTGTNGGTTTMYFVINTNSTYIACGPSSTIWKTTNGGTSWTTSSINSGFASDTGYYLCAGAAASDVYVVGGIGTLYKSTDTGATWKTAGGELASSIDQTSFSAITPECNTLKLMDTRIGPNQTSHTFTGGAVTTQQDTCIAMFASPPLTANTTLGTGSITMNIAHNCNNTNMQWNCSAVQAYVWRPSTKAVVGYFFATPTAQNATLPGLTETVANYTPVTTQISALAGDVIICEIWAVFTQSKGASYIGNFYFDGTTVTTTNNTAVTNHASFIEFAETFTVATTNTSMQQMF